MAKPRRERKPRRDKNAGGGNAKTLNVANVWTCVNTGTEQGPTANVWQDKPLSHGATVLDAATNYRAACALVKTVEQMRDRAAARLLEIAGGVQPNTNSTER